jgi:hypothetical protein
VVRVSLTELLYISISFGNKAVCHKLSAYSYHDEYPTNECQQFCPFGRMFFWDGETEALLETPAPNDGVDFMPQLRPFHHKPNRD